jgi:tetratricopeptide (TPR) repeat protein
VISRTSVMQYKATTKSIPVIARELEVDGIIEGSVVRSGDRVRVTAQLIDAPRDRHVWAESYERDVKDILALQKDVAMSIAREIRLQLTVEEMGRMMSGRPIRPAAYELCLKGRYQLAKVTDASVRKGIEYFQEAIAADPAAAAAYSGLADAHILLAQLISTEPIPVAMPIAKENAKKALELDDSSADAHATMGMALFFGDRDWEGSERHLKRAIELNPGHARMRFYYAVRLGAEGRSDEAVREARKAVELDPLALIANWGLASELVLARRYEESLVQARKTFEIEPGSILGPSSILRSYEAMGRFPEAIETIEKYFSAQPGAPELILALRKGLASDGPEGFWRAYLGWTPPPEMDEHTPCSFTAILEAQAGDIDAAFSSLERAIAADEGGVLWLPSDPGYDPIRKDPRYDALLRRLKVPRRGSEAREVRG